MTKPILLIGGTGMLGSTLSLIIRDIAPVVVHGFKAQADVVADMTSLSQAFALLDSLNPAAIVNLAGLTNVDICTSNPNLAYRLNVRIAENLTSWITQQDSPPPLIHISTDHLYDGIGPHFEENVSITNTYALSKYAGELAALRVHSTVLRTNFFGVSRCSGRSSFTDWLYTNLRSNQSMRVFNDLQFSPLSMTTLSRAIIAVLKAPVKGVFNLGSSDGMSKAAFAFAFAKALSLPTSRMEITSTDKVDFLKTYRPKDMRMECASFQSSFDMRLPPLTQELQLTSEEYQREFS